MLSLISFWLLYLVFFGVVVFFSGWGRTRAVLRAHSWLFAQGSLLAGLGRTCVMLGNKPIMPASKESTSPTIIYLASNTQLQWLFLKISKQHSLLNLSCALAVFIPLLHNLPFLLRIKLDWFYDEICVGAVWCWIQKCWEDTRFYSVLTCDLIPLHQKDFLTCGAQLLSSWELSLFWLIWIVLQNSQDMSFLQEISQANPKLSICFHILWLIN